MMLKKISSPYVGNVIARSMRIEKRGSITLIRPDPKVQAALGY
jgi:hypothetical protein